VRRRKDLVRIDRGCWDRAPTGKHLPPAVCALQLTTMSSARRDLEFVTALAEGFDGQRVIRHILRVIGEQEIGGWEK
jgi:hypothetical protein